MNEYRQVIPLGDEKTHWLMDVKTRQTIGVAAGLIDTEVILKGSPMHNLRLSFTIQKFSKFCCSTVESPIINTEIKNSHNIEYTPRSKQNDSFQSDNKHYTSISNTTNKYY